jgi:hypothetical protein
MSGTEIVVRGGTLEIPRGSVLEHASLRLLDGVRLVVHGAVRHCVLTFDRDSGSCLDMGASTGFVVFNRFEWHPPFVHVDPPL